MRFPSIMIITKDTVGMNVFLVFIYIVLLPKLYDRALKRIIRQC